MASEWNKDIDSNDLLDAGIDPSEQNRAGTFMQVDGKVSVSHSKERAVELLPIDDGVKKYPKYKDYIGRAFKRAGETVDIKTDGGYLLLVKEGHTAVFPIQVCLMLKKKAFSQKVRNLIIVEKGARAYVINGCTSSKAAEDALHLGVSEYFIEEGGYLNFTMIHSWGESVEVTPRSAALVERGGTFISNYVCLKSVRLVKMYPTAVLAGKGARASLNSIMVAHKDSLQDVGSRVILEHPYTSAELVSRTISLGGKIIARGHLSAKSPNVKGHLECQGLVVAEKGTIHAIPELETDYRDVDLSHEAAIGKISNEEIEYLATRGIDEDEARSIIIRGFIDTDILGLPDALRRQIDDLKDRLGTEGM